MNKYTLDSNEFAHETAKDFIKKIQTAGFNDNDGLLYLSSELGKLNLDTIKGEVFEIRSRELATGAKGYSFLVNKTRVNFIWKEETYLFFVGEQYQAVEQFNKARMQTIKLPGGDWRKTNSHLRYHGGGGPADISAYAKRDLGEFLSAYRQERKKTR